MFDKLNKCVYTVYMVDIPKGIEETQDCHCLAARKRARELTRQYEKALRPFNLRATQFSILAALAQTGPVPHSRLAHILGLERTTLTRTANTLRSRGLIDVQGDPEDHRIHVILIAADGIELLNQALPSWKQVQDQINQSTGKKGNDYDEA